MSMRVVYLHQHFRTPDMNGGTRSFEFARRLVAAGHSVDVVTADPAPVPSFVRPQWTVTDEAGASVHWCRVPYANHMGFRERMAAFLRYCAYASTRAATLPQDVVVATSSPLTVSLPGVWSARRNRVPLVFEVRDVWPETPIAMGKLRNPVLRRAAVALESWAYRNSAEVIALSPDMRTSIVGRFPGVSVTVVPNASDLALFRDVAPAAVASARDRRPWLGDRPLVVYTGTFGEANEVGYLVELAAHLRRVDSRVRLLLVGDGKQRAAVEQLARRRGVLEENVFVEDPVPRRDLPVLLAAADLAVSVVADVPALAANSANKVFDAFAAGTPVMVNHGGWLARLLASTGAGFVVPVADPARGADELARRLADSRWLLAAGAAARRLAEDEFDRDVLFRRFERVISLAVARGRG